jgi:hypothetical protein
MFPCGWASWNTKFLKYYDGSMKHFNAQSQKAIKQTYKNKVFYKYDLTRISSEFKRKLNKEDYRMKKRTNFLKCLKQGIIQVSS